jgi:hypothetical protein
MLLSFSLENFRSFQNRAELNFVRSVKDRRSNFPNSEVAPAAAVFGANASGKSNLLRGLTTMFSMIDEGAVRGARGMPYSPFMLAEQIARPTTFSVVAVLEGVRYDYEFAYDAEHVLRESLYAYPKGRPRLLFERDAAGDEDQWTFGDSMTGPSQALAKATRRHALLLSTAQLISHDVLTPVQRQFAELVTDIDSDNVRDTLQETLQALSEDPERSNRVGSLLGLADLGISSLRIEKSDLPSESVEQLERVFTAIYPDATPEDLADKIRRTSLNPRLEHRSGSGRAVALPFQWESVGTRNFLALLGPVLDRLSTGGLLVVDELDTSLHPRLVSEVVRLFQMPETNPHQAQLLISTHDVTVIMNTGDYSALERDQVWFVEKSEEGASRLYSLSDFKPRRDEVFSRSYLTGRYGAIPNIDSSAFRELWESAE